MNELHRDDELVELSFQHISGRDMSVNTGYVPLDSYFILNMSR
jgi:hypothetical protein